MQPAGVRRLDLAGVRNLDGDVDRPGREAIFDRELKGEGIDRARIGIVDQDEPREIRLVDVDREFLPRRETVQAERILLARHARAVARPTHDGIKDRTDLAPNRGIARPEQILARDAPGPRLGSETREI